MDKCEVLKLARTLGVPLDEGQAALVASTFTKNKEMLEAIRAISLEGIEPPVWFVTDRYGQPQKGPEAKDGCDT